MAEIVRSQVERVVEKLKAYGDHWDPALAKMIAHVETLRDELILGAEEDAELSVTAQVIWEQCLCKLLTMSAELAGQHRAMHSGISRIGKDIERHFESDLSTLTKCDRSLENDPENAARIKNLIVDYLLGLGRVDVADALIKEAQLSDREEHMSDMQHMRTVMDALHARDIPAVLAWAEDRCHDPDLLFALHQQAIVGMLADDRRVDAIQYARKLAPFAQSHADEIATIMGAIVAKSGQTRYAHLFNANAWRTLEQRLARLVSGGSNAPLPLILETGVRAVPLMLQLRAVMTQRQVVGALLHSDELPIEVETDHHVHSVFSCPILRAQSTDNNPPMRLSCGHVISREALHKLAQASRHSRLKCPYCPAESAVGDAKRVYF